MGKEKGKIMYKVRLYYTDPQDKGADGKVRINFNGREYVIQEDEEVWVPQEVIDVCNMTEHIVFVHEIDEVTNTVKHKQYKRRRIGYEILEKKTVRNDSEVDMVEHTDVDENVDVEIDGEVIGI